MNSRRIWILLIFFLVLNNYVSFNCFFYLLLAFFAFVMIIHLYAFYLQFFTLFLEVTQHFLIVLLAVSIRIRLFKVEGIFKFPLFTAFFFKFVSSLYVLLALHFLLKILFSLGNKIYISLLSFPFILPLGLISSHRLNCLP